jgi:Cys-tRNA(Pro)/Cys-tRNA(Cys) deacylase
MDKTNAMRMLDRAKVAYEVITYEHKEPFESGVEVAKQLGAPMARMFKTLLTTTPTRKYYVFVIPVAAEIDLKAAARAVNEKSVAMLPVKDVTNVSGYVRGGCSPVGMKKQFQTVFDKSCLEFDTIYVSGGKLGCQLVLSPRALIAYLKAATAELIDLGV